ncbi:hypothetical protein ACU8KH_03398 [Lachancea thermotolerans]
MVFLNKKFSCYFVPGPVPSETKLGGKKITPPTLTIIRRAALVTSIAQLVEFF